MLQAFVQGGATIIGGLLAAAVLVHVTRRTHASEERRWLLDRRLESYIDFATEAAAFENLDEDNENRDGLLRHLRALDLAFQRLAMTASGPVRTAADKVVDAAIQVGRAVAATGLDSPEYKAAMDVELSASGDFTFLAQQDLASVGEMRSFPHVQWGWVAVGVAAAVVGVAIGLLAASAVMG